MDKRILIGIAVIAIVSAFLIYQSQTAFFSHPQGGPKEICAVGGVPTDIRDEHDCFWHGMLVSDLSDEWNGMLHCYEYPHSAFSNVVKDIIFYTGNDVLTPISYKTYRKELDYSTGNIVKSTIKIKGIIPDGARIKIEFNGADFGYLSKISSDIWAVEHNIDNCNGVNTIIVYLEGNSQITINQVYVTAEIFTAWHCNEQHPPNLPNYDEGCGCSWVVDYPNGYGCGDPYACNSRARYYKGDVMCICKTTNPNYGSCPAVSEPNCKTYKDCPTGTSKQCKDNKVYEYIGYQNCTNYRCNPNEIIGEEKIIEECGLKLCLDYFLMGGRPACCNCIDPDNSNYPGIPQVCVPTDEAREKYPQYALEIMCAREFNEEGCKNYIPLGFTTNPCEWRDGGYHVKTSVLYLNQTYTDFCVNDYTLTEYSCNGAPGITSQWISGFVGNYTHTLESQYRNQYLCEDGKFIRLTTTTTTTLPSQTCIPLSTTCNNNWLNICSDDGSRWIKTEQSCGAITTTITTTTPTTTTTIPPIPPKNIFQQFIDWIAAFFSFKWL